MLKWLIRVTLDVDHQIMLFMGFLSVKGDLVQVQHHGEVADHGEDGQVAHYLPP